MSAFTEAFGERLLVARFDYRHSTQEAIAQRAGIHRTQISLLETGRRVPLLDTFVKLAGAVDRPPADLLGPIRWVPGSPGYFVLEDR